MTRVAVFSKGWNAAAWSPARVFLAISGVFHVLIGSVSFIASSSFATGADSGHLFGTFETNGWHNLAGLALGLTSLAFAARPETARFGALSLGITMVVVTIVLQFLDPGTFWLASNGWDQMLHAFAGIGGVASALATRPAPGAQARSGGVAQAL
jgi:hypothetical protein